MKRIADNKSKAKSAPRLSLYVVKPEDALKRALFTSPPKTPKKVKNRPARAKKG